jgi:tetratricopeptide (TPR) repeat protein
MRIRPIMTRVLSWFGSFLIIATTALAQAPQTPPSQAAPSPQTPHARAEELARRAVEAMDKGQIDRALTLLDSAIMLDRAEPAYRYEKGYALLRKGDFAAGLAVVEPLLADTSAADYYYQLAAALHTGRSDSTASITVLRAGIARFPSSGPLHYELGTRAEAAGDFIGAVTAYEQGMRAQPAYPENYYRAALILAGSSERIWGLIYGEMFMNLERQTERTARMGAVLLETYRRSIGVGGDTSFQIRFSERMRALHVIGKEKTAEMIEAMGRPEWLFEMTAMQALAVSDHCRARGVTLDCLDQFRTEFNRRWFAQSLDEKFASPLFDWHKLLIELGYFDEYNHWLLGAGDPDEFYAWVDSKPEAFDLFQKWFRVNGMVVR